MKHSLYHVDKGGSIIVPWTNQTSKEANLMEGAPFISNYNWKTIIRQYKFLVALHAMRRLWSIVAPLVSVGGQFGNTSQVNNGGGKGEARKEVDKKLAMARQDRNLRTMEPENSQIWIFSRHFLRSWCPFYLCYVFKIHFGPDHVMNIALNSLSVSGILRILRSEITGRRFCCAPELSPSGCALF